MVFFDFGDFFELGTGDFADFVDVGFAGALLYVYLFADEVIYGATEAGPVEGAIFVDGDVDDDVFALVFFGGFVEGVDEVHHVETPLTEGGAYWRAGGGFATGDSEF